MREFMQRAAKLILAASTTGPQMDRRIDKYHDCELWDAKLHRWHPVTIRVRVTVRSRILEAKTQSQKVENFADTVGR